MDSDQIDIRIGIFVRQLRLVPELSDIVISENSVELLTEAKTLIDTLIAKSKKVSATINNNCSFLFDLDEHVAYNVYKIVHKVECFSCHVSFYSLYSCKVLFELNWILFQELAEISQKDIQAHWESHANENQTDTVSTNTPQSKIQVNDTNAAESTSPNQLNSQSLDEKLSDHSISKDANVPVPIDDRKQCNFNDYGINL